MITSELLFIFVILYEKYLIKTPICHPFEHILNKKEKKILYIELIKDDFFFVVYHSLLIGTKKKTVHVFPV